MAISITNLTSNNDVTDAQSYNTASISPAANALILVAVTIRNYNTNSVGTITLSGNGLTYVEIGTVTYNTAKYRTSLFRAMGASPTTGAITITISGTGNSDCAWAVEQATGIDTTGTDGSGAIVQNATNSVDSATALTITLAALADAVNNAVYACFGNNNLSLATPGTGYTELTDTAGANIGQETQWKLPGTTTPNVSALPSFTGIGGVAVEIKAAGGGGGAKFPVPHLWWSEA